MDKADMLNLTGRAKSDGLFKCVCYTTETNAYGTSEVIEKPFMMMLEAKLDVDFNDLDKRAEVLLQALCYLKLIREQGYGLPDCDYVQTDLPAVIVLGSKVNCGAISTSVLLRLWPIDQINIFDYKSPSTAFRNPNNAGFIDILKNNTEVNKGFILRDIENGLYDLCSDIIHFAVGADVTEDVSEKNIVKAYQRFDIYVLKKRKVKDPDTDTEVVVDIPPAIKRKAFLSLILADDDSVTYVQSASAKGSAKYKDIVKINFDGDVLEVNNRQYDTFKVLYSLREYTPEEKEIITAVADKLIEEDSRRFKGDYYTPEIWVDEAYKLLDKQLGDNWHDEYIVWDCAWGTGNLTRSQFDFGYDKSLFCSTLREEDLGIANSAGYNPNAKKFQYDYLNDDVAELKSVVTNLELVTKYNKQGKVDEANAARQVALSALYNSKLYKVAPELVKYMTGADGIQRKKLLFIINPPYGTSKNNSTKKKNNSKAGIAITKIRDQMETDKLGMAQRQLYTQFLYRCTYIMQHFCIGGAIAAFTQSDFMTTVSYDRFRDYFYSRNKYLDGFLFSGGHFSNVSDTVGISFTLWKYGEATEGDIILKAKDNVDDKVVNLRDKTLMAADNLLNVEIRDRIKTIGKDHPNRRLVPGLKSGLAAKEGIGLVACLPSSIGGFQCNSNDVNQNAQRVALFSSQFYAAANMDIIPETFDDAMALFTARRLISADWINWKDEYMVPNKEHPDYAQFQLDSIVYSLFEVKSQQTSMRNLEVDGDYYNVYNEFFWMSRVKMMELAKGKLIDNVSSQKIVNDLNTHGDHERYVYQRLKDQKLSEDAQQILDMATAIVVGTFQYRDEFNRNHPEYHINTWDAGWYQIKALAKEYQPEALKAFEELFKQFSDRLRPLVYELGFLYK